MALISQSSRIKPIEASSDGVGDIFNLMDLVIFYIDFGSSQPPVSSKISTAASLIMEVSAITPTNLLKKDSTYY